MFLLSRLVAALLLILPLMAGGGGEPLPVPDVEMRLQRVSEHVYYVQGAPGAATANQGFVSNAGVVLTGEGVVLIDSLGTPALGRLLLARIRELTDQPIRAVLLTHYHADHIYGLQVFEALGAEIMAPLGAEIYLRSEQAARRLEERRISLFPWVDDDTRLVEPDRYLARPETLRLGEVTLRLSPVGGAHSDADMTVYVEPGRVLFSGDIIFEGRVPFVGDANSAHWLKVLDGMRTTGLAALIPGHGPAAAQPDQAVQLTYDYLGYLRQAMGRAVEDFIPFDEAYAATDWSRFASLPAFVEANRRNAYQIYLSLEAESLGQ
ncbi:MBL fold metallo-hydrolase [Thiohalobacter sp. IOR34]|uniref:MBL fold metallo-hydrolase n=1 Tax=Thiohalobacter sp. IOR34 TaxID=3057176 RepID=UPI0025B07140|nr:MBL fold metallo-hydrolase [Thiohalobacter sp. IOR34]WJW76285.1 MBL fold metallo-hydrolase [Thiohalobacter sp. IOR34]